MSNLPTLVRGIWLTISRVIAAPGLGGRARKAAPATGGAEARRQRPRRRRTTEQQVLHVETTTEARSSYAKQSRFGSSSTLPKPLPPSRSMEAVATSELLATQPWRRCWPRIPRSSTTSGAPSWTPTGTTGSWTDSPNLRRARFASCGRRPGLPPSWARCPGHRDPHGPVRAALPAAPRGPDVRVLRRLGITAAHHKDRHLSAGRAQQRTQLGAGPPDARSSGRNSALVSFTVRGDHRAGSC